MPADVATITEAGPAELRAGLAAAGIDLPDIEWRRLGGGRTNHVWKVGDGYRALVVKSYLPEAESPLFPNRPDAEADALRAFGESGLSPRLRATALVAGVACLVYEFIPGSIWSSGTAEVAMLLAHLHGMAPPPQMRVDHGGSARLRAEILTILKECPQEQASKLAAMIPAIHVSPVDCPVPLHGDPVPGNIIRNGTKLTLVDWQCPRLGDPADDIALFLSPAMQHLYRGKPLSNTEQANFLAAYSHRDTRHRFEVLKPLFHLRMAAHCLWKASRGAVEYADALLLELAAFRAG